MAPSDDENSLAFLDELESQGKTESQENENGDDALSSLFEKNDETPVAEATIISEEESGTVAESENKERTPAQSSQDMSEDDDSEGGDGDGPEENVSPDKRGGLGRILCTYQRKLIGFGSGMVILSLVAGTLLFFRGAGLKSEEKPTLQVYMASIQEDTADVLFFDRFLILLGEKDEKAYMLLSLVATPSNGEVYKEVKEKRILCRSVILEVLKSAAHSAKELSDKIASEKLREEIILALNKILVSGSIDHVAFSGILLV